MTRARAVLVAAALAVAGLLAGCSGGEEATPSRSPSSVAPSSGVTPPPISPRTTVGLDPGSTLPPAPSGVPIPIPSDPQN